MSTLNQKITLIKKYDLNQFMMMRTNHGYTFLHCAHDTNQPGHQLLICTGWKPILMKIIPGASEWTKLLL